jgi:D-3-phosphoglycerate dehydrogenase
LTAPDRRILVTPRSLSSSPRAVSDLLQPYGLEPVFPSAGETPTREALIEVLPDCIGWIAGVETIDAAVLEHATKLRAISRFGSGTNNVDIPAASRLGISVLSAPGANAQGVAELALALTLDSLRSVSSSSRALRESRWEREQGREISSLSVLVVGLGAIGMRYAKAMAALGARVTGVDPLASAPTGIPIIPRLEDAIESADVISLHCPVPPDAAPIVDQALLERAQRGVIIVNTARAELVDESALLIGLNAGRVGHYAVDAFRIEPPPPSDLLRHPRVIATPHIGAYTVESTERTLHAAITNLVGAIEA